MGKMNSIATGGVFDEFFNALIDRHYIKYEIPVGASSLPILTCIEAAIMFGWKQWFASATVVAAFGGHWGNMIARFIMVFFAITIWPVVIKRTCL